MEVMGLMLGEFVDEYTVRVIDVFAMPQSGTVMMFCFSCTLFFFFFFFFYLELLSPAAPFCTRGFYRNLSHPSLPFYSQGVSVEAVDPVFQTKMLDMLKQTGRSVTTSSKQLKERSLRRVYLFFLSLFLCHSTPLARILNVRRFFSPSHSLTHTLTLSLSLLYARTCFFF
jgi:hypothetical protein